MLKIYYGTRADKYVVEGDAAITTHRLITEALAKGGALVEIPAVRGTVFLGITPGVELITSLTEDKPKST